MIGSFWNLCRACPSMPVDKLHSEYRSTYRWHEYTGPRQEVVRRPPQPTTAALTATTATVTTSAPQHATAVVTAPAAGATSGRPVPNRADEETVDGSLSAPRFEPALPRRRKHPELAYRTHEFLAMSQVLGSVDSLDTGNASARARSAERGGGRIRVSRRSKSEGPRRNEYRLHYMKVASPPPKRTKVLRSDSDPCKANGIADMMIASYPQPTPVPAKANPRSTSSTEYRLQFAWPTRGRSGANRGRPGAGVISTRTDEVRSNAAVPRKSLSMGAIRPNTGPAAVHRKRNPDYVRNEEGAQEVDPLIATETVVDGPVARESDELRGEEKIQNETISKEDIKPRRRKEFKTEYKKKFRPFSQYDYVEGRFQKKKEQDVNAQVPLLATDIQPSESWYHEVIELRKKAGEYKHRGWGTELVPQHIAELYTKQMTLWEQVSRRSSLSALSLASTAPRSITKEEKEKENNKKSSPTKPFHRLTFTRPYTAQERTTNEKKREKSEEKDKKKEGPRSRKENLMRNHVERTSGPVPARSQSVGPGITASERRSPKRHVRTSSAAPVASVASKTAAAVVPVAAKPTPPVQERRPRPSGGVGNEDGTDSEQQESEEIELLAQVSQEPVIKSPPEPTRVKSPEQILMRSPEPVNWTVPLDTGKTFTVTQNVRQGDLTNRPHSEVKAWTPPAAPPPAPQSAPPQLPQEWKSPASDSPVTTGVDNFAVINGVDEKYDPTPTAKTSAPATGSTLRRLDDPGEPQLGGYRVLEAPTIPADTHQYQHPTDQPGPYRVLEAPSPNFPVDTSKSAVPLLESPLSGRSMASDVLEKARTRFDQFWGKGKDDKDGNV